MTGTQYFPQKEGEWKHLTERIQGFTFSVPRFLAPKLSKGTLITFADASGSAMPVCTYLFHEGNAQLMAKSKLPPLRDQYTVPKMELNALT